MNAVRGTSRGSPPGLSLFSFNVYYRQRKSAPKVSLKRNHHHKAKTAGCTAPLLLTRCCLGERGYGKGKFTVDRSQPPAPSFFTFTFTFTCSFPPVALFSALSLPYRSVIPSHDVWSSVTDLCEILVACLDSPPTARSRSDQARNPSHLRWGSTWMRVWEHGMKEIVLSRHQDREFEFSYDSTKNTCNKAHCCQCRHNIISSDKLSSFFSGYFRLINLTSGRYGLLPITESGARELKN